MSRTAKALLLLEVLVCFLPVTLLLSLGALMLPMQVVFLSMGEFSALYLIGIVFAGGAGLVALFIVLRWLIIQPAHSPHRIWPLTLMSIGILPVLPYAVAGDSFWWKLVGGVPLLCTAHVAYLARDYLFRASANRDERRASA